MPTDGVQHTTITVPEIATRLGVCEETVYLMLKAKKIPNIRQVRRFIISRAAYERWEATIGTGVSDIHDNADPSCARRRKRSGKRLADITKILNQSD
jgi:excisionase family DNA binding protein